MRLRWIAVALLVCAIAQGSDQFGTIVFPNSGKAEAQVAFLRGVLLLHNFAYADAERAFVEAGKIDPKFALARWGEAMTYNHPIWHQVDVEAGRRVLQDLVLLRSAATPRERGYIEAIEALYGEGEKPARDLAYEKKMEQLAQANPDDAEAQVFWALSILGTRAREEADRRTAIQAAAILEDLFPTHPDHPGVLHYLIHAYDDPVHAPLGLRAARQYAKVASSSSHALHMPSHIFLQLGMWDAAARSNEAAYAASEQWVAREHAASGKRDLHSLEWLQYVYLQQHRHTDAKRLLDEVKPKKDESYGESHARENMEIRYAIETGEWSAFDFVNPFGRGMRAIAERRFNDALRAIDDVSSKENDYVAREGEREVERDELMSMLSSLRGDMGEALRYMQLAVSAEATLGVPSGPPDDFKPANELYAELLMKAGRPRDALEQFRMSLLRTPNRAASVAGAARAEAEVRAQAVRSARTSM